MQFVKSKLLEFLEKGDSFVLMIPITKMLEEG